MHLGLAVLAASVVGITVLFLAVRFVLIAGLCCADDGFFALVARSLAERGAYGLPISHQEIRLFDPTIGSGPALIVPAATLIGLFGPALWVPGSTTILLFAIQLVLMGVVLASYLPIAGVLLFLACLLAALEVLGGQQWYLGMLVGEVPALGFVLLGAVTLEGGRRYVLAGLAFGLAFLSKQIALFAIIGVAGAWLLLELRASGLRPTLRRAAGLASGCALPVLAFEFAKLATLGGSAYLRHLKAVADITHRFAIGADLALSERLRAFGEMLTVHYAFDMRSVLAVLLAIGGIAVLRVRGDLAGVRAARLAVLFWAGALVFAAYLVPFSTLWPRYFYLGFGLACAGLAAPFLAARLAPGLALGGLYFLLVFDPASVQRAFNQRWTVEPTSAELSEVARHVERSGLPLIGQWWAEVYMIIYALPHPPEWYLGGEVDKLAGRPFLVASNRFTVRDARLTVAIAAQCPLEQSFSTYQLRRCGADFRPP